MENTLQSNIEDAFNSMLRTDYIPLRDTAKLQRLSRYYVDYFGYLRQIVGESDQLIVGRRGTGKTTLLYRALIECINSWTSHVQSRAKHRTLAIYIDLSKCQTLSDTSSGDFSEFEHVFVSELVDSIREELIRNWPDLGVQPSLFKRIFSPEETRRTTDSSDALNKLSSIILSGVPRTEEDSGPRKFKQRDAENLSQGKRIAGNMSQQGVSVNAEASETISVNYELETETTKFVRSRLTISTFCVFLENCKKHAT